MLKYQTKESPEKGSQFFIETKSDNVHLLRILKREIEDTDFDDEYLQDNIYQLDIVKITLENQDNFCFNLSKTIKHIFDDFLFRKTNAILYVSVKNSLLKKQLIDRYIEMDTNDEFSSFSYEFEEITIYFFLNRDKTNLVQTLNSISEYMRKEYGVNTAL